MLAKHWLHTKIHVDALSVFRRWSHARSSRHTILWSAMPRATTGLSEAMSIAVYMSLSINLPEPRRPQPVSLPFGSAPRLNVASELLLINKQTRRYSREGRACEMSGTQERMHVHA